MGRHGSSSVLGCVPGPNPVETAIYQLAAPGLCAEVTRSLFHCARPYMESFAVYGENACYEWQMESENPMLFRMSPVVPGHTRTQTTECSEPPDRADLLPPSVGQFTKRFVYGEDERHLSFEQGGGHHGSHPHMVTSSSAALSSDDSPGSAHTSRQWLAAVKWSSRSSFSLTGALRTKAQQAAERDGSKLASRSAAAWTTMELSVVTLWSGSSPIHAELVQYFLAETFPVPTRFVWVVNTNDQETQRLLDAGGDRLRTSGHYVDLTKCLDKPGDGLLGKHQHVANLYNLVLPKLDTPLVLTAEDDNLPPAGAYARAANILATYNNCGALCALYRSRINPVNACAALAADRWYMVPKYATVPHIPLYVGFVGAGFTLYRVAALRAGAPFHAGLVRKTFHGWDANLCLQMRRLGWDVILHGAIKVGHHCQEVLNWCARTGNPIA